MRRFKIIAVLGACSLLASAPAPDLPDRDAAQAMAEKVARSSTEAFNAHDVQAFGARYVDDADGICFTHNAKADCLEIAHVAGRNLIEDVTKVFFEVYPDAKIKKSITYFRYLTPEVCVADETFDILGLPNDAGPTGGVATVIYQKSGGEWKVVCERLVAYLPKPVKTSVGAKN
jgi:ketosteroid isomerase-like protein